VAFPERSLGYIAGPSPLTSAEADNRPGGSQMSNSAGAVARAVAWGVPGRHDRRWWRCVRGSRGRRRCWASCYCPFAPPGPFR